MVDKIRILTILDAFKSKKRALNKNAYKALKANQFKNIEYKLDLDICIRFKR